MDDPSPPSELLQWVRVRGMLAFWPALVYESYSPMTDHSHDLSALRNDKPALDAEDRIVYFFGIAHGASNSMSSGAYSSSVVPNLRFCVVPENDLTTFQWDGASDFGNVCRTHNIAEDTIVRAEKNSIFVRACDQATQFFDEADDEADACRLLMKFYVGAASTSGISSSPTKPMIPTAPTKSASPTKPTPTKPTAPSTGQPHHVNGDSVPTPTTLSTRLSAACWVQMEATGWTKLVQSDGSKLIVMPGVSFMDLRPDVTVFASEATACVRFLTLWLASANENDALETLLWSEMLVSGWQTMSSGNETWIAMPNTPFDRFVPNETIFQSKRQAIATFLASTGVTDGCATQGEEKEEEEPESVEEEDEEMASVNQEALSDEEEEVEEEEEEESSASESEGEEEEEAYATIQRSVVKSRSSRPVNAKPTKPQTVTKRTSQKKPPVRQQPPMVVPPFKCTPGKVEAELAERGWYWLAASSRTDNWIYYKPHCKGKEKLGELQTGEDYFAGLLALDAYLKVSGLYNEIVDKLRREHEEAFLARAAQAAAAAAARSSSKSSKPRQKKVEDVVEISDDESEDDQRNTETIRGTATRMSARSASSARGAARRKPAHSQVKRRRESLQEIKFGEIWARLSEKQWRCEYNALGYFYYRPTKKTQTEMVAEEDYFTTTESLTDFLKESGIWNQTALEIRAEQQAAEQTSVTPSKRKQSDATTDEARTPTAKKVKPSAGQTSEDFRTPPAKRSSELEIPETQDLSLIESTPLISPENAATKAKQDSTPLARNLNDAFTPSPRGEKRSVSNQKAAARPLSPRELAQEAVARLSLGFQPESFTHREGEAQQIKDFCRNCFSERRGGSLYLSGSPGCGKSALLRSLGSSIGELKQKHGKGLNAIVRAHLNAMGLNDFNQLFCQLAELLTGHEYVDGEEAFEAIERGTDVSLKRSKVLLLVLDEIDALGKKPSMETDLCRLFELANRSTHTFILVGIANQIDFTERHLESLRVQLPDIKPQVIVFKPYSFQTISDILTNRLGGESNAAKLMNTNGIAFIARKVAAQSGDVRLALDICRRVLQQKLNDNAASGESHLVHSFSSPIPLMDIVKTIKAVLDSKSKSNVSSLPRNLQMILFASTRLVAQQGNATASDSSASAASHTLFQVEDLYESYCDVCHDAGVFKPLTRGEFKLGLETLSSEGMIGSNELKKQLIKLVCTPSELLQTFKHDAYFSRLI